MLDKTPYLLLLLPTTLLVCIVFELIQIEVKHRLSTSTAEVDCIGENKFYFGNDEDIFIERCTDSPFM